MTTRFIPQLKESFIKLVETGTLTEKEVCAVHEISAEEWDGWMRRYGRYGLAGLKVTTRAPLPR